MNKKKLKEKLYKQIDEMEDEAALQMLHEVAAEYGVADKTSKLDELTPQQLARLKKSQEQVKNGNTYTHEEVQQKIKEWRSK